MPIVIAVLTLKKKKAAAGEGTAMFSINFHRVKRYRFRKIDKKLDLVKAPDE